jgi:membrane-associated phospholipid phosphatase
MSLSDILLRIMADGLVVPVVVVGGVAMLKVAADKRYQAIARGVATGLVALFFAGIARLLYQEGARPFQLLGVDPGASYLDNPGFPSDHTLLVFTVTLVVWAVTKNRTLGLSLLIVSVLVAAGRVLALVHTPADVVGGIVCALLAAFVMYGKSLFRLDTTK